MENTTQRPTITISEVITLLENGYSRTNAAKNYNPEIGSIEDYYGLSKEQVRLLFQHPKLQGVRTKKVTLPEFDLVDDTTTEETSTTTNDSTNTFDNVNVEQEVTENQFNY